MPFGNSLGAFPSCVAQDRTWHRVFISKAVGCPPFPPPPPYQTIDSLCLHPLSPPLRALKDAPSSDRLFISAPLSTVAPSSSSSSSSQARSTERQQRRSPVARGRSQSAAWFLFSISEGASRASGLRAPAAAEEEGFERPRRAIMLV